MNNKLEQFLKSVHSTPSTAGIFNPWRDYDQENDLNGSAPEHRMYHLRRYMEERIGKAKLVLCAEAIGFRGGKFSGCALSSERDLIREQMDLLDSNGQFFAGEKFRTSKLTLSSGAKNIHGMIEPTATIAWRTLLKHYSSREFVFWNSHALHPHHPGNMLTNRTPTPREVEAGLDTLTLFLSMFQGAKLVAVGNTAAATLASLNIKYEASVRHPANGGATKFASGISSVFGAC